MPATFSRGFQPPILWIRPGVASSRYGAITLYRAPFQKTSREVATRYGQSEHHIARRLRFGLCRVHSPLVTTSRSFSLPAPTKMFQSGAFPIARSNCEGIPIRKSQVLSFRAAPLSLSQLGTSFIGARAELSTRWHSSHDGCQSDN